MAEKVIQSIVERHDIEEILWDVDGTLVIGHGLKSNDSLVESIDQFERLKLLLKGLPNVQHLLVSRNRHFAFYNPSLDTKVNEHGFDGYIKGLNLDLKRSKGSINEKRSLLIDDSLEECAFALGETDKTSVVAALQVKKHKGMFASLDKGDYLYWTVKYGI
jgi:hypothetical protein